METTPPAAPPRSRLFKFLWGFDALVAAVFVFFFIWGLADGTVSSFNGVLWLGTLAVLALIVGGSLALQKSGHNAAAIIILLLLALPGFGFCLFFGALIILQPRWN